MDDSGLQRLEQVPPPADPYGGAEHCYHLRYLAMALRIYHAMLNLANAFFSIPLATES